MERIMTDWDDVARIQNEQHLDVGTALRIHRKRAELDAKLAASVDTHEEGGQ